MRNRLSAVLSLLVVLCLALAVHAQSFRGSIQGTVTDATGAAIPGAQVKITSPGTGLTRTVSTNDLGGYIASELPLGIYNVTVERQGFRSLTLTKISVSVGAAVRADARLATGEVREVVEVTATCRWWRLPPTRPAAPSKPRKRPSFRSTDTITPSCWNWFPAPPAIRMAQPSRPAPTDCSA